MAKVALTEIMNKMKLENFTPEISVEGIMITHSDVNRPALQLAGFFDHFDTERLCQYNRITIGSQEQMQAFLERLAEVLEELA